MIIMITMNRFLKLLERINIDSIEDDIRDILVDNGIIKGGVLQDDARLQIALLALKNGNSIDEVAKALSWKDFERFASIILQEYGYQVYNSIRIKRREIDILAIDNDLALVIDCKHWKYNNKSRLRYAINKQIERVRLLFTSDRFEFKYAIPVILTLYEDVKFIDNVPIVSIEKFSSFINEYKGYTDMLLVIKC
ncbi:MAG: restriction endonuclease [Candidatus Nitrosocaldaceae archaeon]